MGEAKRRGPPEARKAQAIERIERLEAIAREEKIILGRRRLEAFAAMPADKQEAVLTAIGVEQAAKRATTSVSAVRVAGFGRPIATLDPAAIEEDLEAAK